jgi:hypothetical protein
VSGTQPLWLPLGELLVEHRLLSQRQLELALAEHQRTGTPLGEVLVSFGFVSRQALTAMLLEQVGLAAESAQAEMAEAPERAAGQADGEEESAQGEAEPAASEASPSPPRADSVEIADAPRRQRPRIMRMDANVDSGRRDESRHRLRELEALIVDFEQRSREIHAQIAAIRQTLADVRPTAPSPR